MLISDLKNPYIQLYRTKINLFFKFDHWSLLVSVPVTIHLGRNAPHRDAPRRNAPTVIKLPKFHSFN